MSYWIALLVTVVTIEICDSAGYYYPPWGSWGWPQNPGRSFQSQTTEGPNGITRNVQIGGGGPQIQGGNIVRGGGSINMGDWGGNYQRQGALAGPNTKVKMTQKAASGVPTVQVQTVKGKPGYAELTQIGSNNPGDIQYQGANGNGHYVQVGNGVQIQGVGGIPDANGVIFGSTWTPAERAMRAAEKERARREKENEKARERLERDAEKERERQEKNRERQQKDAEKARERLEKDAEKARDRQQKDAERARRKMERDAERARNQQNRGSWSSGGWDFGGVGYQSSVTSGPGGIFEQTQIGSGPQIQGGNHITGNGKITMGSWPYGGYSNGRYNPQIQNVKSIRTNGDFNMADMGNYIQSNGRTPKPGTTRGNRVYY